MTDSFRKPEQIVSPFDPKELLNEDERFYIRYVDRLMNKRATAEFGNGRPFHAVYLIYKFLMNAQCEVRLFSGSLTRRAEEGKPDAGLLVYEDMHVLKAVRKFLGQENTSLKIVLEKSMDIDSGQMVEEHPLVRTIIEMKAANQLEGECVIKKLALNVADHLREKNTLHHMLLMDDSAYRFEISPDKAQAYVNVNDKVQTKKFVDFYDQILFGIGNDVVWSSTAS